MLHSGRVEALFAVSASVRAVLGAAERVELTVDWDSVGFGEAVVIPEHLKLVVVYFGFAVESVEEREQVEVLERLDWTALVIQPWTSVMPLACDDQIEASAGYSSVGESRLPTLLTVLTHTGMMAFAGGRASEVAASVQAEVLVVALEVLRMSLRLERAVAVPG